MNDVLNKAIVVLGAAVTYIVAASAGLIVAANEIAAAAPEGAEPVVAWILRAVSVLAAAVTIIRRVTPVPAGERGRVPRVGGGGAAAPRSGPGSAGCAAGLRSRCWWSRPVPLGWPRVRSLRGRSWCWWSRRCGSHGPGLMPRPHRWPRPHRVSRSLLLRAPSPGRASAVVRWWSRCETTSTAPRARPAVSVSSACPTLPAPATG